MYKFLFTIATILYFLPVKAQQYPIQAEKGDYIAAFTSIPASESVRENRENYKSFEYAAAIQRAHTYNYKREANKYKTIGLLMASAGGGLLLGGMLGLMPHNEPPPPPGSNNSAYTHSGSRVVAASCIVAGAALAFGSIPVFKTYRTKLREGRQRLSYHLYIDPLGNYQSSYKSKYQLTIGLNFTGRKAK
jgi:hypothetical protein